MTSSHGITFKNGAVMKKLFILLLLPFFLLAQQRAFKSVETNNSEKRVALVIGNGAYKNSPLKNPPNDAKAMTRSLQSLGFTVFSKINASKKEMRRAIDDFGTEIRNGGVGLFYYAGHGVQFEGKNYLLPIDADIVSELDVDDEAVSVDRVLARMEDAKNRMNIVVLDACRNNPFASTFRSVSRGLAQMKAPAGTFIAYATAPGSIAADGDGANGLYTQELLKEITNPNQPLEFVFKRVLSSVKEKTNGQQIPWTASSVEGDFYFAMASENNSSPSVSLPNKPTQKSFSLSDLDTKAKEEEAIKNDWSENLKEMTKAYNDVLLYEKRDVSAELKKSAWQRFIAAYGDNNPYSQKDDDMRSKANTQYTRWASAITAKPSATLDLRNMTVNSIGMEFVLVEAGTFQMGSSDDEADEKPVHNVKLTNPYYIGKYEVTQKQFREFVNATGYKTEAERGDGSWIWNGSEWKKDANANWKNIFIGDNRPVVCVSWNDAIAFIKWLNQKEGTNAYRLPTEAEWEFAARGGKNASSNGNKFSGSNNLNDVAVNSNNSRSQTANVGSKQPNELGIYDMTGNVWEWCNDWYDENYYKNSPTQNPQGANSGSVRILRGGSWGVDDYVCRVAFRLRDNPESRSNYLGFRLAQDKK